MTGHVGKSPFGRCLPWNGAHPCNHVEEEDICKQGLWQHEANWGPCGETDVMFTRSPNGKQSPFKYLHAMPNSPFPKGSTLGRWHNYSEHLLPSQWHKEIIPISQRCFKFYLDYPTQNTQISIYYLLSHNRCSLSGNKEEEEEEKGRKMKTRERRCISFCSSLLHTPYKIIFQKLSNSEGSITQTGVKEQF